MELLNSLLFPFMIIIISSHLIQLQCTVTALDQLQPKVEPKQVKVEAFNLNPSYRGHRRPRPRGKIFHPPTGQCVLRWGLTDPLKLGPCSHSDSWYHTPQNLLTVQGTYYCLQAVGAGQPVRLSIICDPSDSQWSAVTSSPSRRTHLATVVGDGTLVCLDVNSKNVIVSNPCGTFGGTTGQPGDDTQWFKLIKVYNYQFFSDMARIAAPVATIILVTWCHRDPSPDEESLRPDEMKLLNKISSAHLLPAWCSAADYANFAESLKLEDIKRADWSENVAPFWSAAVQSGMTWQGITSLLRSGWKTIKSALAVSVLIEGYNKKVIKYNIITCCKAKIRRI